LVPKQKENGQQDPKYSVSLIQTIKGNENQFV